LSLDEINSTRDDIQAFLQSEFSRIKCEYSIPDDPQWPQKGVVQSLIDSASGQFIYTSTAVKFVDDRRARPKKRLDIILGTSPRGSLSPFAGIDALYSTILSNLLSIPAALLILREISGWPDVAGAHWFWLKNIDQLDELFLLDSGEASLIIEDLHSIVAVPTASTWGSFSIRRKSLLDFLFDESRSGKYCIHSSVGQGARLLTVLVRDWLNKFDDTRDHRSRVRLDYLSLIKWWHMLINLQRYTSGL
jgi:hypothetical protein